MGVAISTINPDEPHSKSTKIVPTLKTKPAMSLIPFKQFDDTKMVKKLVAKPVPLLAPIRQKVPQMNKSCDNQPTITSHSFVPILTRTKTVNPVPQK